MRIVPKKIPSILRRKPTTDGEPEEVAPTNKPPKTKRIMTPERRQTIITRIALSLIAAITLLTILALLNILPDSKITNYEIRLFAVLFLVICVFMMLAVFMLRNAVVSNTGFLIRLKDSIYSSGRAFKEVEREISGNTDAQNSVANAVKDLNKTMSNNVKKNYQ